MKPSNNYRLGQQLDLKAIELLNPGRTAETMKYQIFALFIF
jgi:hypothetical protein